VLPLRESIQSGVKSEKRTPAGKFNAKLVEFKDGTGAVLKKRLHSNEDFRGVPKNVSHIRENAYYELNKLMGFNLVPETLWIAVGSEKKPASLQRFVFAKEPKEIVPEIFDRTRKDWKIKVAKLASKIDLQEAKRMVILDLLANNTDRHARNLLIGASGKVWAIDNGLSFAPFLKNYRNVIHKYVYTEHLTLPDDVEVKLRDLTRALLDAKLGKYGVDTGMILRRAKWILDHKDDLSFKKVARQGYGKNDFPSYREELLPERAIANPLVIEAGL
jgi:hypothetical protein